MYVCFIKHTKICAPTQQTTSFKVLKMSLQYGIGERKENKKRKITLTYTYREISFCPSSNNTPSSPPSCVRSTRKAVPEEKYNDKLLADYYISPLVVDDDLKIGDATCRNCYMRNHTLSKQDCDSNNGDVMSGYVFLSATLSTNVNIQLTFIICMGIFKRVVLVLDMVMLTATLIYNIMVLKS